MRRALVLGGGGVTGIAWEVGVIAGLAEAGVDLREADVTVGTSAGAAVAAQITSDEPLADLVARQRTSTAESKEIAADLDLDRLISVFLPLFDTDLGPEQRRALVGAAALAADTVPEPVRLEAVAARLPNPAWPEPVRRTVVLTAVDAESGAFVTFDAGSGVALVDAVAASCAVPGVWPPVTIGERRYIDGGVRSATSADLAFGSEVVVVLSPMDSALLGGQDDEIAMLERAGSRVLALRADADALAAMGTNALDPAFRAPAVEAGLRQGRAAADAVRAVWGEPET
jgi:NTE family protein